MVAGGSAAAAVAGVGPGRRGRVLVAPSWPHASSAPRPRGAVFADGQGVSFAGGEGADAAREVYVARGRGRGLARRPAPSEDARGVATCVAAGAVDEEDDVRPTRGDGSWVLARVRRRVDETRGEDVVARARGCRGWFLQDVVARALAPRVQSPAGRVVRVDARDGEPPSPVERVPRRRHRRGARHQPRVARVAPGPPVGKEPALVPRPRAHRVARARRGLTRWAPASPEGKRRRHVVLARGARKFSPLVRDAAVRGEGFPMPPQSKALADRSRRRRWASRRRRRSARRSRLLIYASSSRRLGWTPQAPSPPCWSAWRRCASSRATRRVFPRFDPRAPTRDPIRAAPLLARIPGIPPTHA